MDSLFFCIERGRLHRLSLHTVLLLFFVACTLTRARAQQSEAYSLNGEWQFALAPNAASADAMSNFHRPDFQAREFRPIKVPSNWALGRIDIYTLQEFGYLLK